MNKTILDKTFWNERYVNNQTGWDLGEVSPPLKHYIDQLENTSARILIPGAGNAYEMSYLIEKGFSNVSIIDIAPRLIASLKKRKGTEHVNLIEGDFFNHSGTYDLILEQTFFCAISPDRRDEYVKKMHELLDTNGKLCGVLFDREFEGGPPFGGNRKAYKTRFENDFTINTLETCYNSHPAREGSEVWINLSKR